jgi:hypothetical protein
VTGSEGRGLRVKRGGRGRPHCRFQQFASNISAIDVQSCDPRQFVGRRFWCCQTHGLSPHFLRFLVTQSVTVRPTHLANLNAIHLTGVARGFPLAPLASGRTCGSLSAFAYSNFALANPGPRYAGSGGRTRRPITILGTSSPHSPSASPLGSKIVQRTTIWRTF